MDYQTYAADAARKRGIDPALFSRLIQQESTWDPSKVSPVGAKGLTQVMPDTARDPGFGVAPLSNTDDPYAQIDFGADYLAAMTKRYNGDTNRALAAYNWGAGNADKWNGDVNSLPEETRDYLNIVGSGQGGNLSVSSSDGAPDNSFGNLPAAPRPGALSTSVLDGPTAGQTPNDVMQRQANMALMPDPMQSPGFQPMDQGFGGGPTANTGALSTSATADPAAAAEAPDTGLMARLFPNQSRDQRNDRLLALGAGLLAGDDWSSGLAAASQNIMGVVGNERAEESQAERDDRNFQNDLMLAGAKGGTNDFKPIGNVEMEDGSIVGGVFADNDTGNFFVKNADGTRRDLFGVKSVNNSDAAGTKMVSGTLINKTRESVIENEGALRTIDRIIPELEKTTFGIPGMVTELNAFLTTAAGSRDMTPAMLAQKIARGEMQGQIGSNKQVVGDSGVLTENDAVRIITFLGGDLSSIGDNPTVIIEMLRRQREEKQRAYTRDRDQYDTFRGVTGADSWTEIPEYTNGPTASPLDDETEALLKKHGV